MVMAPNRFYYHVFCKCSNQVLDIQSLPCCIDPYTVSNIDFASHYTANYQLFKLSQQRILVRLGDPSSQYYFLYSSILIRKLNLIMLPLCMYNVCFSYIHMYLQSYSYLHCMLLHKQHSAFIFPILLILTSLSATRLQHSLQRQQLSLLYSLKLA